MIEVWSGTNADPLAQNSLPCVLAIQSNGGGSSGPYVALTLRSSVRVCLFGDTFTLTAWNLSDQVNSLQARAYALATMCITSNVFEQGVTLPGAGNFTEVEVPGLAQTFRFDVPESQKASVYVELLSGYPGNPPFARYSWYEQPSGGIPVGGAALVMVHNGVGSGRVDFKLGV